MGARKKVMKKAAKQTAGKAKPAAVTKKPRAAGATAGKPAPRAPREAAPFDPARFQPKRRRDLPEAAKAPARERITPILASLDAAYPAANCALDHVDALQLTAATILSAQCTDARVNMVTPKLFARYRTARDFATADVAELESIIQSTGFYHNKAKSLIGMGRVLHEKFGGELPRTIEEMLHLPGVARKTANVVLGTAFGITSGVVVDTHVSRISQRLGLTKQTDPVKIELDLQKLLPRDHWIRYSHQIITHGRAVCDARKPKCGECVLAGWCPSAGVAG